MQEGLCVLPLLLLRLLILLLLLTLAAVLIGLLPGLLILLGLRDLYSDLAVGSVLQEKSQRAGVVAQELGGLLIFRVEHYMEGTLRIAAEFHRHSPQIGGAELDLQVLAAVAQGIRHGLAQSGFHFGRGSGGVHRHSLTHLDGHVLHRLEQGGFPGPGDIHRLIRVLLLGRGRGLGICQVIGKTAVCVGGSLRLGLLGLDGFRDRGGNRLGRRGLLLSLGGTGSYLVFFADPEGWASTMLGNGTEQSYIDTMRMTGTTGILLAMQLGTVLAAALSAFVGGRMLKEQFEKAGITK